MTTTSQELAALFRRDICRLRNEMSSFHRAELFWQILPGIANSAGNLALHLHGNLREYIGRQLGQIAYQRDRACEFSARDLPMETILSRLADVERTVPEIVESLSELRLNETYPEVVLEAPVTVRYFLIHLHSHLMYHLGQINYIRRLLERQASKPGYVGSSIEPSR